MFFKNLIHSGEKVDSPQISFFNGITEKYSKICFNTSFNPLTSIKISVDNVKHLSLENKIDFPLILYKWNKLMKNQNILTNIINRFFTINKNINVIIKDYINYENNHDTDIINNIYNNNIFEKIKLFLNFENKLDSNYLSTNSSFDFLINIIDKVIDKNNFVNGTVLFYKSKIETLFSSINLVDNHLFKEYKYNLSDINIFNENNLHKNIQNKLLKMNSLFTPSDLFHNSFSFKYLDFITLKSENNLLTHKNYYDLNFENLDSNNNVFFENVFFKYDNIDFHKSDIEMLFSSINLIENHLFKEYKLIISKLKNNLLIHKSNFDTIISKLDSDFLSTNSNFDFLINLTDKNYSVNGDVLANLQDYSNLNPKNYGLNINALLENTYLNFNDSKYSNKEFKSYSNIYMEFKKNSVVIEELNEKYDKLNNSFNELNYSYDELIDKNYNIEYSNVDVDNLADEVYSIIERRLIIEKERRGVLVRF